MSASVFLEGRRLTKAYDGVTVIDGVDIAVEEGEIRAVIGENGAGKSTLMKMLTGIVQPDHGEIKIRGRPVLLRSSREAADAGIAIVHQELQLAPLMSVADNLMLVRPPGGRGLRRGSRAEKTYVRSTIGRVGLDADPAARVADLSVAQCQMLEIAKALALDAQAIVFDEPTSALQPAEAERLMALIESLRTQGHAILYISHALDEILRLADRISVLRDGRLVKDLGRSEANRENLILAMVDRPVGLYTRELAPVRNDIVMTADRLSTAHVRELKFELRAGEILGFAGMMGSGMQEAGLALCGAHAITAGTLTFDGQIRQFRSPREAAAAGVVIVPEERKRDGIVPGLSVCENLHIGRYRRYSRRGFIHRQRLRRASFDLVRRFQVRLASIDQPIATLSGGNQQKVLIARCVQSKPRVLIIASPTRGVDIGAKEAIHTIVLELAADGAAVILISPELEELLGLAHRIAVFSEGGMTGTLSRAEATPARIMELAMAGAHHTREHAHVA